MNLETVIDTLITKYPGIGIFDFEGKCCNCGQDVVMTIILKQVDDKIQCTITGGAGFGFNPDFDPAEENPKVFDRLKCEDCWKKHGITEVYSRIVGYLRPVSQWNTGKISEFNRRKMFDRALNQ